MTKKIAIIIISLMVLFILVGVGIYLSLGKKTPVIQQTPPAKKLTEIKVANWKTYQNKDFSFQYPGDWQSISNKLDLSNINLKIDTFLEFSQASDSALINVQNGRILDKNDKPLDFDSIVSQRFGESMFIGPKKIKLNNKDILTYVNKQNGLLTNYLTIAYDGGVGNYYEIAFDYGGNSNLDYKSLFDQMINSFKFTDEK